MHRTVQRVTIVFIRAMLARSFRSLLDKKNDERLHNKLVGSSVHQFISSSVHQVNIVRPYIAKGIAGYTRFEVQWFTKSPVNIMTTPCALACLVSKVALLTKAFTLCLEGSS